MNLLKPWLIAFLWVVTLLLVWVSIESRSFTDILSSWDTGWYKTIINNGYAEMVTGDQQLNVAFFPLHPILAKLVVVLSGVSVLAALTSVAWLSLTGWTYVLQKLTKSWEVMALVLAQPTAFVFMMPYTESLFLLLSLSSYYFIKKEQWLLASLMIGAAGATRTTGVLLVVLLLGYLLVKKPLTVKTALHYCVYLAVSGLGALSYMIYLFLHTGDALAFKTVQSAWGRSGSIIDSFKEGGRIARDVITLGDPDKAILLSMIMFAACLLGATWLYRNKYRSEALYIFGGSMLPILSGTFASFSRYSMVLLPFLFIPLSPKLSKGQFYALLFMMLIAQIIVWGFYIAPDKRFIA